MAKQERSTSSFGADVAVGVQWDSNVSIEELETDSGADDVLAELSANLKYKTKLGENNLSVFYSASNSLHDVFGEFDLLTQIASADLSRKFGSLTAGANARYIDAKLDSSGLLAFSQGGLYVSSLINRELFVRSEFLYTDKSFDELTGRSATTHGISTDAYLFQRGGKQYWMIGLRFENEDAFADQFDRTTKTLSARFQRKFEWLGKPARARVSARAQLRDYDSITPSIGQPRDDERLRAGAQFEMGLVGNTYVQLDLTYADNKSNLPSADYSQTQVGVTLGWRNQ
ncbi:MAG: DUF560 domain-containing protein [Gammaproteobacteria bacterium]|nr:DUF560 domain-containing protein [Gammaproteobacteria bacterium]